MANLQHIVTDLHQVYLTEMEAKIQPKIGKKESPAASGGGSSEGGGDSGGDPVKKQARQLAYDTRYKARREGIPLERAFTQTLQNSKASAPVKDAAKAMLFGGGVKEEVDSIEEEDKQKVLVTPAKGYGKPYRRYASRTKIHQLRSNPQIQSVTGTSYGNPYEGEKKKGEQTAAALQHKPGGKKAKKDYDGDGKIESGSKEHAGAVHNAIQKSRGGVPDGNDTRKKGVKKESAHLSDWRQDLHEVISKSTNSDVKKISEKNVDNKIIINPELKEEFFFKSIEIATEYFYEQGLNSTGLDILIENLGLEEFAQFVFELGEEYELTEAKFDRLPPVSKSGKNISSLKGGAKASAIKSKKQIRTTLRKKVDDESKSKPGFKSFSQKHSAVANAKKQQPAKKPLKDRIAKGVLGAVKAYQQGMERHRAATATAGKAVKVAAKGATEFGKGVASGVKATAKVAKAAHKVLNNSYEMDEAVYGGEKKEPEDKRMTVTAADKKANTKAWQKFSAGHPSYKAAAHLQNSSFEPEGDSVDERFIQPGGGYVEVDPKRIGMKSPNQNMDNKIKQLSAKDDDASHARARKIMRAKLQTAIKGKRLADKEAPKVDEGLAQARKNVGASKCWPGKVARGTKMKNGREVPNCVPEAAREPYAIGMAAAMDQADDKPPLKKSTITKAHKIAKKIEAQEAVDPKSALSPKQKDTERQQTLNAKAKLERILSTRKGDYREETELDELNRYEKEKGKDLKTGKPVTKGGTMGGNDTHSKVMRHMHSVMGAGRMGAGGAIQQRGKKKVKGAPTPGPSVTPAQKVAKRRADAQRAQDMMHSRYD